jgi:hypothetical protein
MGHGSVDLYPGSMTVELRRITLDPNGNLPPLSAGMTQFIVALPANLARSTRGGNRSRSTG